MKRILSFVLGAFGVVALGGCPIYSNGGQSCQVNADCGPGGVCDSNGTCQPGPGSSCSSPSDCPSGTTCNSQGYCQNGDCTQDGCVSGYTCKLQSGTPACVANGGDSGTDSPTYSGCFADTDCAAPTGSKCLNSVCTAPANQCADATQCGANEQCVQGVCTPSCSSTTACPTGYTCDIPNGVCNNAPSCSKGSSCSGNAVCVQGHCDSVCSNGTCSNGLVCINGGCMPDQKPNFICNTEGVQDACASGSICLRHNCYIGCTQGDPNACKTADQFNICKAVTTQSGTYNVCGSNANLGSDCDPTIGKNCPGVGICIDGYCH